MIYGANGYTGRLLASEARNQGLRPILAGRNPAELQALAAELQLECRVFDLQDREASVQALQDVRVVAHCAGPFNATSQAMIDACLASACHYLDITGEVSVFLAAEARDAEARQAGVVLCPGAGFDVMPTDCLAATLKLALADATHLALGFDMQAGMSPGTAKTTIEGLGNGGLVRENGLLRSTALASDCRDIDFGRGVRHAACIPWGDVATAYVSTGIPNIAVYFATPKPVALLMRWLLNPLRPLLRSARVQDWLKQQVERRIKGPDEETRRQCRTWLWGEARNPAGQVVRARLETANGYDVTVHGVLLGVRHLLDYQGAGGYFTPSRLLGPRCIEQLPGSSQIVLS
ncbi:saccharopine dehydrogenase NADP-binding domain-containing protein [Pseudomonas sp. N040]|nr:saccharopine dehydrogenase NADP-binding domain-containing protein [Pseudomonas sp. N040]